MFKEIALQLWGLMLECRKFKEIASKPMTQQELTKQDFFTSEEVALLEESSFAKVKLGKARYSFEKHTNYTLLMLLLKTGLRASEASSLTLTHIKKGLKDGEFAMVGKGALNTKEKEKIKKSTRMVLLNTTIKGILTTYLEKRQEMDSKSTHLFIGRDGQGLNKFTIWHRFKTMCRQAEVEAKRTHATRHTCGMNLYKSTMDILTTSSILGHKDVRTTQIYVKATEDAKRKAIEMI